MVSCRAVAYLIEVRKLNARANDNLKFKNFNGADHLRTVLEKILLEYDAYKRLPLLKKLFRVELYKRRAGPLIGRFHAGEYGQAGDIIENTKGNVAYRKGVNEALPEPFFFQMSLPDNETRGIVCLQQTGLTGVKGLFETAVVGVFEVRYPEYRLHVRQLTVADTLSKMLKDGHVEEIIVEKHEIPADIADRFGAQKKAYPGKFTYSIQPESGFLRAGIFKKDGLIAYAKGERSLADVFEFDDNGFDVVKTKIRVGNDIKTVNLTKPDAISSSFDISNDIAVGADGHPTPQSLEREFEKIVIELAKRGGIRL